MHLEITDLQQRQRCSLSRALVWSIVAVLGASLLSATGLGATRSAGAQGAPVTCWAIADNQEQTGQDGATTPDTLVRIDNALTNPVPTIAGFEGQLGLTNIEAMAIRPSIDFNRSDVIWAWDGVGLVPTPGATAQGLVLIDTETGDWSPAPFQFDGQKVEGLHWQTFNDDDETNDVLWSIGSNGTVQSWNAGGGIRSAPVIVTNATFDEGTDIAVDPIDGAIYAVITNNSDATEIVRVEYPNGPQDAAVVTPVGPSVVDLEGLGFAFSTGDTDRVMVGSTGNDGPDLDRLFTIDRDTGEATLLGSIGIDVFDHEGVDCIDPRIPVEVQVTLDKTTNGFDDAGQVGIGSTVTWNYRVTNPNGTTIRDIAIVDDREGAIACPATALLAGDSMDCIKTGVATAGQYENTAVVTATRTDGVVAQAQDTSRYFGSDAPIIVGNRFWVDQNANGRQDSGENGVGGVVITLLDENDVEITTTTTAANGTYEFQVTPGRYRVRFPVPAAGFTTSNVGSDDLDSDVDAQGLTDLFEALQGVNRTVDAGAAGPAGQVLLGNRFWFDLDGNGLQDIGENGVGGATVRLVTPTGNVLAEDITASNGTYRFDQGVVGGEYLIEFVAPNGEAFTVADAGGNDSTDSDVGADGRTGLFVVTGGNDFTIDAGIVPAPQPASLGNRLWEDSDGDGIQDPGENGFGGETVILLTDAGTEVDRLTTASNGTFLFTGIAPGAYRLQFPTVGDYSPAGAGGDDRFDSDVDATGLTRVVTLVSGERNLGLDAGRSAVGGGRIGSRVWADDGNGLQGNERGVENVTVRLLAADDSVTQTTTTAANGTYSFSDVALGTWTVEFEAPAGFGFTPADVGGNDLLDSDPGPDGRVTVVIDAGNRIDLSIDAGLIADGAATEVAAVTTECVGTDGRIVATMTNVSGIDLNWEFDVVGAAFAPLTGSISPDESLVRQRTGRPDGAYLVDIQVGSFEQRFSVTVACD